jgi:hypothetical protein
MDGPNVLVQAQGPVRTLHPVTPVEVVREDQQCGNSGDTQRVRAQK